MLMERVDSLRPEIKEKYGAWTKPDFDTDPWGRTGLGESFECLDRDNNSEEIRLGWIPSKIERALVSLELLGLCNVFDPEKKSRKERMPTEAILEVSVGQGTRGWHVNANLGDPVWEVIKSNYFSSELMPIVRQRLRRLWEDWYGSDHQYGMSNTMVFDGNSGKVLQIYHPVGNGLWIVGSQEATNDYQLIDHNTDSYRDAFAHIYGLCVVLDECRKHIESSKTT